MAAILSAHECEFLTRKEAAEYLRKRWRQRVSAQTLATYASREEGPAYRVSGGIGGTALYTRADLDSWVLKRLLPGRVAPLDEPRGALSP